MAKQAIRPPKHIDWPAMRRMKLTVELSRRGLSDMPHDIAAERMLVALHEAAHFLVAAHDGLGVHGVKILTVHGKNPRAYARGCVSVGTHANRLLFVRFFCAGSMHEQLMTGQSTISAYNDWGNCYEDLIEHCETAGIDPEGSHRLHRQQADEVQSILRDNWYVLRILACAFLIHHDAKGAVPFYKCSALYKLAQDEMTRIHQPGCCYDEWYGSDVELDDDTVLRVGTQPEAAVEKHVKYLCHYLGQKEYVQRFAGYRK